MLIMLTLYHDYGLELGLGSCTVHIPFGIANLITLNYLSVNVALYLELLYSIKIVLMLIMTVSIKKPPAKLSAEREQILTSVRRQNGFYLLSPGSSNLNSN